MRTFLTMTPYNLLSLSERVSHDTSITVSRQYSCNVHVIYSTVCSTHVLTVQATPVVRTRHSDCRARRWLRTLHTERLHCTMELVCSTRSGSCVVLYQQSGLNVHCNNSMNVDCKQTFPHPGLHCKFELQIIVWSRGPIVGRHQSDFRRGVWCCGPPC